MIRKRIQVWVILLVLPAIAMGVMIFLGVTSKVDVFIKNNDKAAAVVFIIVGLAMAFPFIMGAINLWYVYTTEVIVDETGISWKNIFHKNHLDWEEVKTFGVAHSNNYRGKANTIYFAGYVLPERPKFGHKETDLSSEFSRNYVDIHCSSSSLNFLETIRKMSTPNKKEIIMLFKYTPEDWNYIISLEPVKKLCEEYNYHWDTTGNGRNCYYDPNEEPPKSKLWEGGLFV